MIPLSKEVKVRRLKAQISEMESRKVTGAVKGKLVAAVESRQLAVEFLEKYDKPNLTWRELEKKFGFGYYEYLYRGK